MKHRRIIDPVREAHARAERDRLRKAAMGHYCEHRIQARTEALLCAAEPGQPCRDPRTGLELTGQPAHLVRLKAAGVAATPCMSGAVA